MRPARPRMGGAAAAAAATWAGLGVASAGIPSLDPATYVEPLDTEYWADPGSTSLPATRRLRAAELDRDEFDRNILEGRVFVVEGVGSDWPMASWDCDYFRSDPTFAKAEMNRQYAAGGGMPFVGFKSDWVQTKVSSGAQDKDAPQLAPHYWGIKDVQYPDAHRSPTWRKSMLKKVQEHIRLPPFMDAQNLDSFKTTPEFWFAGAGAGAKAHMDSHVQATMSLQLAGAKRWRMALPGERRAPYLAMIYQDGDVYEKSTPWSPHVNVTLRQGEALFFPPGTIHETLNADESEHSCTASVTFQFSSPMAARFYRRFLPRVRRTADIHEAWPLVAQWATLHRGGSRSGLPYGEARAEALGPRGAGAAFASLDADGDGALSSEELVKAFGGTEARNLQGFHDLDEDGAVARGEYAEVFGLWAGTVHAVLRDTPKKFRRLQLEDMEGDVNIEDLPGKTRAQLLKAARKFEAEQLGPRGGGNTPEL